MKRFILSMLLATMLVTAPGAVVTTGCAPVGIPDPEVRLAVVPVVDHLMTVYYVADDANEATRYLLLTKLSLNALKDFGQSELDEAKLDRLIEGVDDVLANLDDPTYVRQRARSLATLAASMGLFNDLTAVDELLQLLDLAEDGHEDDPEDDGAGDEGGDPTSGSEPAEEGPE